MAQPFSVLFPVPWLRTSSKDLQQPHPHPPPPAGDPLKGLELHYGKLLVEKQALFSRQET